MKRNKIDSFVTFDCELPYVLQCGVLHSSLVSVVLMLLGVDMFFGE